MSVSREVYVYRLFDRDGRLLYVGCSGDVEARMRQHGYIQPWWADVARVDTVGPFTRMDGLRREKSAIRCERPLYNVTHNPAKPLTRNQIQNLTAYDVSRRLGAPFATALTAIQRGYLPDRDVTEDDIARWYWDQAWCHSYAAWAVAYRGQRRPLRHPVTQSA